MRNLSFVALVATAFVVSSVIPPGFAFARDRTGAQIYLPPRPSIRSKPIRLGDEKIVEVPRDLCMGQALPLGNLSDLWATLAKCDGDRCKEIALASYLKLRDRDRDLVLKSETENAIMHGVVVQLLPDGLDVFSKLFEIIIEHAKESKNIPGNTIILEAGRAPLAMFKATIEEYKKSLPPKTQ